MSGTARTARRRAEQRKEQARIWGTFEAVAIALVPFIVPRLPLAIITALLVILAASWPMARDGYKYRLPTRWAACVMLAHAGVLALLGYAFWPRITVSPDHVAFQGFPNETFNFSVKNGRSDDVYDVEIPILIGYGKHWDSKLSAKTIPNSSDPRQRIYVAYNYCYGKKGDVSKVLPNEREVLIAKIPHLAPLGVGSFSVKYTGGEKFTAKVETPNFTSEPYSYSTMQGTAEVRGSYRICEYRMETDGLMR